jgi:hypothetical protein
VRRTLQFFNRRGSSGIINQEKTMDKIDDRSTVESAAEAAGASKSRTSQSLRLDKQTIRTLTGAELRSVGGGCSWTITEKLAQ